MTVYPSARHQHEECDTTPTDPSAASGSKVSSARSSIDHAPVLQPLIQATDDDEGFSRRLPCRDGLRSLGDFGLDLHPETARLVGDPSALSRAFGGSGPRDWIANRTALLAAICACMGGLAFGFDQGLVSITLVMPHFLADFPETDSNVTESAGLNKGIMTALLELGAFIGAIFAGFVADRYSRKASMGVGLTWFTVGSLIQTTSHNLPQLICGRFIGGVGIGLLSSTAPSYVSECAPPNIRGAFLTLCELSIVVGIVSMFYITYATRHIPSDWSYRTPFLLQIVPAIPLAIGLFYLPFSPRWLAMKGRDGACLRTLCRLRDLPPTDPRIQAEWITIRAEALLNREDIVQRHPDLQGIDVRSQLRLELASWVDMFQSGVLGRTLIGILLMVFQQLVGINALIYYSPTLFATLGLEYEAQLTMSGIMNVIQLSAVVGVIPFLDKLGRRPPLLVGSAGMAVCHTAVAIIIAKYSGDWSSHFTQAWTGVGFVLAFMFFFGIGWAPVPWSLPSEIHTSSRRAKGVAIATCSNWFSNFLVGLITPPLIQHTGYGTFIFFAFFSALSGIWTWLFVPETKGKTLEELDSMLKGGSARRDRLAKEDITAMMLGQTFHERMPSTS